MSLAARLKLPSIKLPAIRLPHPRLPDLAALSSRLSVWAKKHRRAILLTLLAFLLGLSGAELWLTSRQPPILPVAAVELGPVPLPLVAGRDPIDRPLAPAPRPDLIEEMPEGKLPVISASGMTPVQAYAYPFDRTDARPRISIVLTDAGLQGALLETAVRRLPGAIGLAFNSLTPALDQALAGIRQRGHETLLMVPADGLDPAAQDPGPGALRNALPANDNIQRLHLILGRGYGYVGLVLDPRTAVLASPNLAGALLTEGQKRGLGLLSASDEFTRLGAAQGSPAAAITLALDRSLDPAAIDSALAELEQRARESGHAIATSALYPFVIDKLADWLPTLAGKGIALAPVSAAFPLPPPSPAPSPAPAEPGGHH